MNKAQSDEIVFAIFMAAFLICVALIHWSCALGMSVSAGILASRKFMAGGHRAALGEDRHDD